MIAQGDQIIKNIISRCRADQLLIDLDHRALKKPSMGQSDL